MVKFLRPIQPSRGTRNTDAYGSGTFGASRDGGTRKHLGRDYIAVPDDPVIAPITGTITRIGQAYSDSNLHSMHIEGERVVVKLLYVEPSVVVGERVEAGNVIGTAQDVAAYYEARSKREGRMINHVHVEMRVVVDPEDYAV